MKILSSALAAAVLISALAVNMAVAADDIRIWDGTYADSYAGGTGTADDPYLIETPEQLARMIGYDVNTDYTSNITNGSTNKYYKLTADIYLNDVSADNWYEESGLNEWYGTANSRFCGSFDGGGYTVYGLYGSGTESHGGLFPRIDAWDADRTIENLRISRAYLAADTGYTGAIAGYVNSGNMKNVYFKNCYVDETVIIETPGMASGFVGSLAYESSYYTVENSASLASKADGSRLQYGFAGNVHEWEWGCKYFTVNNSFAYADEYLGASWGMGITNSYLISDLESIKGEAAKTAMPDLDWDGVWQTVEGDYPTYAQEISVPAAVWDGSVAEEFAGGTGTAEAPYLIENGSQLALMVTQGDESKDKYYRLAADIYLNDTTDPDWKDNSPNRWYSDADINKISFQGSLDGGGHTVYGLYYKGSDNSVALIPRWKGENVYVKDIRLADSYIESSGFALAAIAGNLISGGSFTAERCYVYDSVTVKCTNESNDTSAGGLFGYGIGTYTVRDCAVLAERLCAGKGYTGAVIANAWSATVTVSNVFATGVLGNKWPGAVSGGDTCYTTENDTVYVTNVCAADKMKGSAAQENMPKLNWNVWVTTEDSYPVLGENISQPGSVWNGTVAGNYAGGNGTKETPYLIATGEQLARMVTDTGSAGKYYKITEDIKLNDVSADNWTENATQWIWSSNVFSGTVDGDCHTISGLYYNGTNSKVGLFAYVSNAVLERIIISDAYLYSTGFGVGALVGDANSGTLTINQCYVTESVSVESTYNAGADAGAGGLVGYGGAGIIVSSSAYLGTVKAPLNAGALLGNCWYWQQKVVTDSFAAPSMKFCSKSALSAGSVNNYGTGTEEELGVTLITVDQMKGPAAEENMPNLNWLAVWEAVEDGFPVLNVGSYDGIPGEVWTGKIAADFAGGDGSEEDPYLISTGEQLALMVTDTTSAGKYYKITEDIKLNDTSAENWTENATQWIWSSNVFAGTVDGDCHTISGLYYNGTNSKVGLFSYVNNAALERIIISDAYLYSTGFGVGALVGDAASGTLTINQCYVTETVSVESTYNAGADAGAGGLVGYGGAGIIVSSSAYLGTVKAPGNAGAMLGNCWNWQQKVVTDSFAAPSMKFCSKSALTDGSVNNYGTGTEEEPGVTLITVEQMKGPAAEENMPNLNWLAVWEAVEDGFPVLNVGSYDGIPGEVWTGKLAADFAGGDGSEEDPYLISTGEQLALVLSNLGDTVGKHYKITDDIYLNDISNPDWESEDPNPWFWVSAARQGNFNGHLDGDGHVIYGLYLNLEQTTGVVYTGLFPTVSDGTVIEKVGISHSHIKVTADSSNQETYVGGIAGQVFFNKSEAEYAETGVDFAEIKQCFGDTTVLLEGMFAGGIIGGGPYPADISDCYFVGDLTGDRVAGIFGNCWTEYEGAEITRCYSATADNDLLGGGRAGVNNSITPINYHDNYATSGSVRGMVTQMTLLMMRGDKAPENMTALDFENVWYALPNGTPVLRIFGTTDKFSNTSEPEPIEVSFVSNGGSECESIYGNPEEPINLPTPTRDGYTFGGWYVFRQLDYPFSIDVFPYFDQTLYAKWIPDGFVQDFENYTDSMYDTGEDYEYYRPGATGYDANYVRSGMSGMHRLGNTNDESDFLVLYEDLLTVGRKYTMTFYITSDKAGTSADISLVFEDYPDVYDSDSGVEKIDSLTFASAGEWKKVEYTFIARTQWIAIRTSGGASLYFDDIMISSDSEQLYPVPEDENSGTITGPVYDGNTDNNTSISDGQAGENNESETKTVIVKRRRKSGSSNALSPAMIAVIVTASVVVLGATAAVIIIFRKRKKKIN